MRRRTGTTTSSLRIIAAGIAVALLATACTRMPPDGGQAVSFDPETGDGLRLDTPSDGGDWDDEPGAQEVGAVDGQAAGGGTAPQGAAEADAAPDGDTTPGAPAPGTAATGPVQGVADDGTTQTVKFVYSTQLQDCGSDPTTANQGTANEKGLRVIEEWVGWFNEEVLAEAGFRLEYEVVDDGGPFCPEKAQAAAVQITKDIRPFAVLSNHVQPARGPIIADAVTREGIVHIGDSWSVAQEIRDRAPYAWPPFAVAERLLENLIAWAELRVKGTQVADGLTGQPVDRSYGLLAIDSAEGRELGAVTRQHMIDRGMEPTGVYLLSGDPGIAAQQANNAALRMRQDGVNTVVFAVPYPSAINTTIVLSEAMNAQNYLPDILVGNYGLSLFDSLHNRRVWARARGTSQMPALVLRWAIRVGGSGELEVVEDFDEIAENENGYGEVWQRMGHNDHPQDDSQPSGFTTWTQLSLLVTGLLHVEGPLTPHSFGEAVHSARRGGPNRCTIGRFMQRDYDYSGGFHWELGASSLRGRSTSVYWVNRQTPMGSNGYYESYDNYRFHGAEDWPAAHTRDTGVEGIDIPKQDRIGIRPWTPCSQFPNYPTG